MVSNTRFEDEQAVELLQRAEHQIDGLIIKNRNLAEQNQELRAALEGCKASNFEDVKKFISGAMLTKYGATSSEFSEMDIGWNNALNMVLGYIKKMEAKVATE